MKCPIKHWLRPSLYLYLAVMCLDWMSSYACWIAGTGHETNAFARNEAMNFVWHKAVIVDSLYLLAYAAVAIVGYHAISRWKEKVAQAGVCAWFAYVAADRLLSAVVPNVLLALHFYVADPNAGVTFLLGKIR